MTGYFVCINYPYEGDSVYDRRNRMFVGKNAEERAEAYCIEANKNLSPSGDYGAYFEVHEVEVEV